MIHLEIGGFRVPLEKYSGQQLTPEAVLNVQEYMKEIFLTPEGAEALAYLLVLSGAFQKAHTPGDPYTTTWKDGARFLPLKIIELLQTPPAQLRANLKAQTQQGEDDEDF